MESWLVGYITKNDWLACLLSFTVTTLMQQRHCIFNLQHHKLAKGRTAAGRNAFIAHKARYRQNRLAVIDGGLFSRIESFSCHVSRGSEKKGDGLLESPAYRNEKGGKTVAISLALYLFCAHNLSSSRSVLSPLRTLAAKFG
jgi:hypothetical protein